MEQCLSECYSDRGLQLLLAIAVTAIAVIIVKAFKGGK